MLKRYLVITLFLFVLIECLGPNEVTLEFRIAEDEPATGLTEMIFEMTGESFYLHKEVLVDQSNIDTAIVTTQNKRPAILLVLTREGTRKFAELTQRNVGKRCAMILNGELVSAPRIMAPIVEGRAILAGNFTESEANRIAEELSRQ